MRRAPTLRERLIKVGRVTVDLRQSASVRGYDHTWSKVSKAVLREEPVCRLCREYASELVDHIIELRGMDDPLRLERSNLRGVCRRCHAARHNGAATATQR